MYQPPYDCGGQYTEADRRAAQNLNTSNRWWSWGLADAVRGYPPDPPRSNGFAEDYLNGYEEGKRELSLSVKRS